jgi:hypothetical protein
VSHNDTCKECCHHLKFVAIVTHPETYEATIGFQKELRFVVVVVEGKEFLDDDSGFGCHVDL